MASISNFLEQDKTYSEDFIKAYQRRQQRLAEQQAEIDRQIKEQEKKDKEQEEAFKTAKSDYGIDDINSRIEAEQEVWRGGQRVFNNITGKYEKPVVIMNDDGTIAYTNLTDIDKSKTVTSKVSGFLPETTLGLSNLVSLGLTDKVAQSAIADSHSKELDEKVSEIKSNEDVLKKSMGEYRYNQLLQEARKNAGLEGTSLQGYAQDIGLGSLQIQRNKAWDQYLQDGSYVSKKKAEELDKQIEQYRIDNPDIGKQTFSTTAQFLPQSGYQLTKNIPGAALAIGATVAGAKLGHPELGKVVGRAIYGTSAVATGAQMTYEQTRGGEFGDMVSLGIPEDIARAASADSAFWQTLVEEGEEVVDIVNAFKVPQKKVVIDKIRQAFKNYGVNILTEGTEEGTQSIIGFVYEKDAARRAGLDTSDYTLENMFSQAWEEFKGGAEIGATMYIADNVPHIVIGAVTNNRNQRLAIQDAPLNSTIAVVPTNTDEYGNQTVNKEQFKKVLTQTYDEDIKKAKEIAAQGGENAALANNLVKQLEAGKERNLKEKTFNTIVDGVNQSLDAQATNKTQTLTKQTQTFANDILKSEQDKARNSGFKNMEFNVADKITAGQKNLASFAKNNLGLNVVYYTTKNGKEGSKVYRHRGIWIEGDTIFVNQRLRTTKNALSVIGHEYAHDNFYKNEDVRNKVYATYSNEEAIAYGRDHGWDKPGFMSQEEINKYKEEMYADDVGEYISQQEVINQIESGNKSAAKVIKDTLANIIENTTGYRPQFDNISQYNMSGTSVLNGVELSNELKEAVDKDIENRQNNKKLSKKETSNKETTKETSKKETAAKLTPDQKQNERWYEEQKKDNKSRDQIQKSLALRMKKAVNSTEVKAEMTRLEKKYNQTKRSAEITGNSKSENKFYDTDGRRLGQGIVKYNRNSAMRSSNGRLIYWYHTNRFKSYSPFSEINPIGSQYYRYDGQVTFFATNLKKMSLSYAEKSITAKKDRVTMKQIKQYIDISNAFGVNIGLVKTDSGEYYITDNSKGETILKFENQEDLKRNFRNAIEFTEKIAKKRRWGRQNIWWIYEYRKPVCC